MSRPDNRSPTDLRPFSLRPDFIGSADGSCLVELGRTRVVCTATIETGVPRWAEGRGFGWVSAEYGMLPASGGRRIPRPGPGGPNSRAVEIRRLIGRSLRAAVELERLGLVTVTVDCDVLEADGGTRTASITGGWVALARAVDKARREGKMPGEGPDPIIRQVVATSCGIVDGEARLDLAYAEDSAAEVDLNVAMTPEGELVDVQASGEKALFSRAQLDRLLKLARAGCAKLAEAQRRARTKR